MRDLTLIVDSDFNTQIIDNSTVDAKDFIDCDTRLIQKIKEEDIITNKFLRVEDEINHYCEELLKKGRNPDIMLITEEGMDTLCDEFGLSKECRPNLISFASIFGTLMVHKVKKLDGNKRLLICCS